MEFLLDFCSLPMKPREIYPLSAMHTCCVTDVAEIIFRGSVLFKFFYASHRASKLHSTGFAEMRNSYSLAFDPYWQNNHKFLITTRIDFLHAGTRVDHTPRWNTSRFNDSPFTQRYFFISYSVGLCIFCECFAYEALKLHCIPGDIRTLFCQNKRQPRYLRRTCKSKDLSNLLMAQPSRRTECNANATSVVYGNIQQSCDKVASVL